MKSWEVPNPTTPVFWLSYTYVAPVNVPEPRPPTEIVATPGPKFRKRTPLFEMMPAVSPMAVTVKESVRKGTPPKVPVALPVKMYVPIGLAKPRGNRVEPARIASPKRIESSEQFSVRDDAKAVNDLIGLSESIP